MAHIWFITEGNYWKVQQYIAALSGQLYDHVVGDKEHIRLQYNIRPVQLWSLSVYDHHVKRALHDLAPYNNFGYGTKRKVAPLIRTLARLLGVKPVPTVTPTYLSVPRKFVNVLVLGKTDDPIVGGREFI